MHAHRTVGIVCALGILLAACSGGGKSAAPTTTLPPKPKTTVPNGKPAGPTTTTTISGDDPCSLMMATVPSGFKRQADDLAETGPTNAEKAGRDDPSESGADVVRVTGFQRGCQRVWEAPDGLDTDTVFVYQFATSQGAQQWLRHWLDELTAPISGVKISDFDVVLPQPAYGVRGDYTTSSTSSPSATNPSSGVVVFAKGPYAVQAGVHAGSGTNLAADANALAAAQYARLP